MADVSYSLRLGETSRTAYRGDRGKTAYDHSQLTSGNPHGVTKSDVGLGNVDNTSDLDKPLSTAVDTYLDTNFAKLDNDTQDIVAHELSVSNLVLRNTLDTASTGLSYDASVLYSSERLTLDSSFQVQASNFEDNNPCLGFGWQPLYPNVFCGAGAGSWNDGVDDWNKGTLSFICNEDSGTLGSKTISIDGETGITLNAGTGLLQLTYQTVAVSNALAFSTAIGLGSTSSPSFTGLSVTGTGTLRLPSGTTGQRVDTQGIRYNSTTGRHEFYTGATWYNHARLTGDTFTGAVIVGVNGALSAPAFQGTGTWITGGTATTTKPCWLLEPTGATSTAWSTSGTGLGINSASGFAGNQIDIQANGTSIFRVNGNSQIVTCTLDTLDLTSSFSTTRAKYYHSRSGIGAYIQTVFGASNEWVLIGSDAAKVPFSIRGAASQTANIQTWANSSGTVLAAINKDGIPIIPTSTPASASATGTTGMLAWDSSYLYICTASNTWRRVLHETW